MCLTEAALWMFLALLPPEIVTETDSVITVHATEGDNDWVLTDGMWCNASVNRLRP